MRRPVVLGPFVAPKNFYIQTVTLEIGYLHPNQTKRRPLDCAEIGKKLLRNFVHQCVSTSQQLPVVHRFEDKVLPLKIVVKEIIHMALASITGSNDNAVCKFDVTDVLHATALLTPSSTLQVGQAAERGMLVAATQFIFKKSSGAKLELSNSGDVGENSPFGMEKINFMNMGIGGLDTEFQQIFRRAFATRLYPAQVK